ncbi:hypothetical protein M0R36_04160 [bacterium]|jgi:hypothetical protein|nr:hypothetical protein [bacterium]
MIKVNEKLLIAVKVKSITESEEGISYRVCPLGKERYTAMDIIDTDIQSCLVNEIEGGKK